MDFLVMDLIVFFWFVVMEIVLGIDNIVFIMIFIVCLLVL